ncbi:hypothetical protein [Streptomyces monashensis]|uniref:hypothetical protein n=1 Tax=Streptomyces monashensis TaxID=1678012 RepID=UPI0015A599C5|nr:hypothetical protein [Streptomyces monashensis]
MTRTVRVAFIGGIVGVTVAIAVGHGSFSPSVAAVPAAGSSVVRAGDVGWNIVKLPAS